MRRGDRVRAFWAFYISASCMYNRIHMQGSLFEGGKRLRIS